MPVLTRSQTHLQRMIDAYRIAYHANREQIKYYRQYNMSLCDIYIIKERCDVVHELYKAKINYAKAFHGKNYDRLVKEYHCAMKIYHKSYEYVDEDTQNTLGALKRRAEENIYKCINDII